MYCCRKYSLQKVAIFNCQHKAYNVNSWNRIKDFFLVPRPMGGRVVQLTYWFPFLHLANLILTFLEWYCCDRNQKDHRDDGISKWTI